MKKTVLAALVVTLLGIIDVSAQTRTFTAPVNRANRSRNRNAELSQTRSIGAFPRTQRNPIQLLNPRAPARYYGPPQETVVYESQNYEANRNHPRVNGLILFGLAW